MTKETVRSLVTASHRVKAWPPMGHRKPRASSVPVGRVCTAHRIARSLLMRLKTPNHISTPLAGIARDCQTERLLSISLSVLCGPNFWLSRITHDKVAGKAFSGVAQQSQEGDIMSQDVGT